MSQPSMSGVHVPTLLKVVRRRKRRKKKKDKKLAKHMGPGPHPSGTEQDVHGRGRRRASYNETEHRYAQERITALRDEIDDLIRQRSEMLENTAQPGHAPPELDLDAYEALNRRITDTETRMQEFISQSVRPNTAPPETGIHRFTGSLTQPQIEAVGRRLKAIDSRRRNLLDQLEERRLSHVNDYREVDQGLYDLEDQIKALDVEEGELLIALTTPTLPGFEQPVRGAPVPAEKDARSYSSKNPKTGKIIDAMPVADAGGDGEEMAQAIFEAELQIDGEDYLVQVEDYQERDRGMGEYWKRVQGGIYHDGKKVGRFNRSFPNSYTVHNDEFYIDASHQGRGIGTMLLSHWESELAEAGYSEMKVTAADIGRYAWAVSGYDWDHPNTEIMDDLVFEVQNYNESLGLASDHYDWVDTDVDPNGRDWNEARAMVRNWTDYDEAPQPWEIAMLGAGTSNHFGKDVLMSDGMWDGVKYIGN